MSLTSQLRNCCLALLTLYSLGLPGHAQPAASPARPAEQPTELKFLTWSEYMDPALIKKFEQQYNARLVMIYFETDDTRDEMVLASDGKGYDMIMLNGVMLEKYVKRGWLAKIDAKQVPNLKYIDSTWRNAFTYSNEYGVPYFWGTLGIAYRQDLVKQPVTSWKQLFKPSAEMQGKIMMLKASRDLLGAALKALGYSINTANSQELAEAEKLLLAQKPHVKEYSYLALNEESSLVKGEIVIAMCYNGDALMLQEHNENIQYVFPEEGGELWGDYFVVTATSSNRELAHQFINFMHEPKHAAQQAEFVYYASPNQAAEKHLPAEFLANKTIYPDAKSLNKSETYKNLPPRISKQLNAIYSRVIN